MEKLKVGFIGFLKKEGYWEDVQKMANLGYLGHESPNEIFGDNLKEGAERLRALGLTIPMMPADIEKLRQEDYKSILDGAQATGCRKAVSYACAINAAFWNQEPSYDWVMRDFEVLEKAATVLSREGITLCYHNHFHDFVISYRNLSCFDLLLHNTEKLQIELDVGWVMNGLEDPLRVMDRLGSRLSAIHMKDFKNDKPRDGLAGCHPIYTTVGNGELKVAAILEKAQQMGIEWAIVEQDELHQLSATESLTVSYLNMKETGFVR